MKFFLKPPEARARQPRQWRQSATAYAHSQAGPTKRSSFNHPAQPSIRSVPGGAPRPERATAPTARVRISHARAHPAQTRQGLRGPRTQGQHRRIARARARARPPPVRPPRPPLRQDEEEEEEPVRPVHFDVRGPTFYRTPRWCASVPPAGTTSSAGRRRSSSSTTRCRRPSRRRRRI